MQEGGDGGGLAGQGAQRVAVATVDRLGADDTVRRQMVHQAEEERQVPGVDALFIEREEVLATRRGQQGVGILDTFGNAFEGVGFADVVFGEEGFKLRVADFRIDRHYATSVRGTLNTTLSSVVRTSSTVTSKRSRQAAASSSTSSSGAEAPALMPRRPTPTSQVPSMSAARRTRRVFGHP